MRALAVLTLVAVTLPACAAASFTDDDRARLVTYWNAPGRYVVSLPPASPTRSGPWQAHLTPEASKWFLRYRTAVGAASAPPTVDAPAAGTPAVEAWDAWVKSRLAYDTWLAQGIADAANASAAPPPAAVIQPLTPGPANPAAAVPPAIPAPIPADLLLVAGNPPPLSAAVTPLRYTVTFDDGDSYVYDDHVPVRPTYPYYRFANGVVAYGRSLRSVPDAGLAPLFLAAGMTGSEERVAMAVSRLEGGFDSINTYDTGCISVGFIQFTSGDDGRQSLCSVLAREKAQKPDDFAKDFRQYGIDVTDDGILLVVDPSTGAELTGSDAVSRIIDDKRLTAVFQRAGKQPAFEVAQIQQAKAIYWPADDSFSVVVGGQTLTGKVSDVIHSEAGTATLFDRKVNRGNIRPFADVVTTAMAAHGVATIAGAAAYEREIVTALRYRADFLADATLSQPAGNQPAGNQPPGNQPAGNQPPGNQPPGNQPPAVPQGARSVGGQ